MGGIERDSGWGVGAEMDAKYNCKVKLWAARKHLLTAVLLFSSNLLFIEPAQANLYAFTSHTFTNCSATGRTGPTQVFCRSAYSTTWDENDSYFTATGGIQNWVAPATASYIVTAAGATGVGGARVMSVGAIVRAKISLTQGSTYKILIGQSVLVSGKSKHYKPTSVNTSRLPKER